MFVGRLTKENPLLLMRFEELTLPCGCERSSAPPNHVIKVAEQPYIEVVVGFTVGLPWDLSWTSREPGVSKNALSCRYVPASSEQNTPHGSCLFAASRKTIHCF